MDPKPLWQDAIARFERIRTRVPVDLLLVIAIAGVVFGLMDLAGEVVGVHRPVVEIDLSPGALPRYTFYSLTRGLVAYAGEDAARIIGKKTSEIAAILGYAGRAALVHRDDMVLSRG